MSPTYQELKPLLDVLNRGTVGHGPPAWLPVELRTVIVAVATQPRLLAWFEQEFGKHHGYDEPLPEAY
jgi:hypothetical protein